MKDKKLFFAVGPFLVAVCIVAFIFYSPFPLLNKPSAKSVQESASSMSINVLKGNALKNEAMKSEYYLPIFGSSELSRVNSFHPSVLAKKYKRNYEPYLLGAPGTQSLTHFFMLNSMAEEMKHKKLVFIISPQWFVKDGGSDPMFSLYYSALQTSQWLMDADAKDPNDEYVAKRLLSFSSVKKDKRLKAAVKEIQEGESLTTLEEKQFAFQYQLLSKEDLLFSKIGVISKQHKINHAEKRLPKSYLMHDLENLANKEGEASTNNNAFGIDNHFYSKRIMRMKDKLKGAQKKFNYLSSPEYADFQTVLNKIAENDMDVLFVIPPVNKRWSDYTGLSQEMLKEFSKKINYQLSSQGFEHVADYTDKASKAYFMEDTIHLGWHGWLNLDNDLEKFLANPTKPNYTIHSEEFLSTEWQEQEKMDF